MDTINVLLLSISVITAGLSLFIVRGKESISNKVLSIFILSISLWSFGVFGFRVVMSLDYALALGNINYITAAFIASSFLHFSYIFPYDKKLSSSKNILLYLPPVLLSLGFIIEPNLILSKPYFADQGLKLVTINTLHYAIYSLYFITYITYAYINLLESYRRNSSLVIKSQLKLIIIGTLIPFLFATYFDLILAATTYKYIWAGPFMAFIVVYIIVHAIYRHHLLNIELITAEILMSILCVFIFIRTLLSETDQGLITNIGLLILTIIIGVFMVRSMWREIDMRKKTLKLADELKEVNSQLSSLNSLLEQKVAEQTKEIRKSYDLEKHARRELEKLNETKDQFIMITQHQLRLPVMRISEGVEAITDKTQKTPDAKTIENMRLALGRLTKIVDDFLGITILKAGGQILNMTNSSLKSVVEDALRDLKVDIENMDITVTYSKNDANWPTLSLDIGKMREAILIITENAVRYNLQSGKIDIQTTTNGNAFEFIIENTGVGIAKTEKENIVNKLFYRGDKAKQMNPIGMGVGLSVARSIVRAHGGTLDIGSDGENKGAKVTIKLPATRTN